MLVQEKIGDDPYIYGPERKVEKGLSRLRPMLDQFPLYFYFKKINLAFSSAWVPDSILRSLENLQPDLIHLQWWNKGFMRISTVGHLTPPIIWTLHDMWPFTGGCHYDHGCGRYVGQCGACPQLKSQRENDLSRWVWQRKRRAWRNRSFTIVCPSRWIAQCAQRCTLFSGHRIEVIPNGLDTTRFRPVERVQARQWLGFSPAKKLVLFSGIRVMDNPTKGSALLRQSLDYLVQMGWQDQLELIVLGSSSPAQPVDWPIPVHYVGRLQDEVALALVYAAVDVNLAPSVMDNLPNTVMESLACGTPVAAFRVGGLPDMITHQENGYLAEPGDPEDLANGIDWILDDSKRYQSLAENARQHALQNYDQRIIAHTYSTLYQELLEAQARTHG
jgi:glycosyltransferase involved in cell wall biosynthesis